MKHANFRWSVRRELWEHRSVFWGPLAVGIVAIAAWFVYVTRHTNELRRVAALAEPKRAIAISMPYSMAASLILLTAFVVGMFYCLDALNAERRDRSILFWKSMPVSDTTTVLAKAFVPFAVLPAVGFVVTLVVQGLMLLASGPVLPIQWDELHLGTMTMVMAYGLAVHALWFAPLYGYLLLVSAWARRAAILWAVLPIFAIAVAEQIALGTAWFASAMRYRFMGAMAEAFAPNALHGPITELSQLTPAKYFSTPNLWLGLVFAAAFIYAAIHMRRRREPT